MTPEEPGPVGKFAWLLGVLITARTLWRTLTGRERPAAPSPPEAFPDPSQRSIPSNRRAETLVAALLLMAALLGFGFTAVYVLAGTNTQLLGLAIGGALALLAAAAIVAGKFVVPQETSVEPRGSAARRTRR